MQKYFSLEGGIYRVLTVMFDLIVLNVWMIVTSLPLVTIGASISAAYVVAFKLVNGETVSVRADYLAAFRGKAKISSLVFLGNLLVMTGMAVIIKSVGIELVVFPLLVVFAVLLLLTEILYPLISVSDLSLKDLYRQSFGITLQYLVYLVACFMLTLIAMLWPIFLVKLSFVWLALGGSLSIYLKSKLLNNVLIKLNFIQVEED